MATETSAQPQDSTPQGVTPPGRWLRIARLGAMLFMAFCIVTFVWGLLLFPRFGLANLDAIRPNDRWSDATLLAVIAEAGLSVAALAYAKLAVGVLAAVLLAVFAIAPPARPLGADSFLISSPQSIGGRS